MSDHLIDQQHKQRGHKSILCSMLGLWKCARSKAISYLTLSVLLFMTLKIKKR